MVIVMFDIVGAHQCVWKACACAIVCSERLLWRFRSFAFDAVIADRSIAYMSSVVTARMQNASFGAMALRKLRMLPAATPTMPAATPANVPLSLGRFGAAANGSRTGGTLASAAWPTGRPTYLPWSWSLLVCALVRDLRERDESSTIGIMSTF
jgi:hypothetical protein